MNNISIKINYLIIILLCLFIKPLFSQISYDNNAVNTLSLTIPVGDDKIILAMIASTDLTGTPTATLDGNPMLLTADDTDQLWDSNIRSLIFYLPFGEVTTEQTATLVISGLASVSLNALASFSGIDQANPLGIVATLTEDLIGTNESLTMPTSKGNLVVDFIACNIERYPTAGLLQTQFITPTLSTYDAASYKIATTESTTFFYTLDENSIIAHSMIELRAKDTDGDGLYGDDNCPDAPNPGLNFDGVDDYVTIAQPESDFDFTNAMTVEAWIKVTEFPEIHWTAIVTKGDDSWRLHRYADMNTISFGTSGLSNQDMPATTNVDDGKWHHVAGVFDGTTKYIYIDGILENSSPVTGSLINSPQPVRIGLNQYNQRFFNGTIDEVRIWRVARSAQEIQDQLHKELVGNETGLIAYYNFNEGIPESDNSNIPVVYDNSGNNRLGRLLDFAKTGTTSNWTSGAPVNLADVDGNGIGDACQTNCDAGLKLIVNPILPKTYEALKIESDGVVPITGSCEDNWTLLGAEGNNYPIDGTKYIRYGAQGTFIYAVLTDNVPCNNGTFGDPTPGVAKECWVCEGNTTPTTFKAAVDVSLQAGFHAPSGSYFTATIEENCTTGTCGDPIALVCGQDYQGNNGDGINMLINYDGSYGWTGPELVFTMEVPANSTYQITMSGLGEDLDLTQIEECSDIQISSGWVIGIGDETIEIENATNEEQTYYFSVDGWEGAVSDFTLSCSLAPLMDNEPPPTSRIQSETEESIGKHVDLQQESNSKLVEQITLKAFPNPFKSTTTIAYQLPEPEQVSIYLFDFTGKQLEVIQERQEHTAGHYQITYNNPNLENGMYYFTMLVGKEIISKKVIMQR